MLLTARCIQQGYTTKTKMQQLAEGNVTLKPVKKHRRKKHAKKLETEQNPEVSYKTKNKQHYLANQKKYRQHLKLENRVPYYDNKL